MDYSYTILIPLLPFITFLILGLGSFKIKPNLAGLIGSASLGTSLILSLYTAYNYFIKVGKVDGAYEAVYAFKTTWMNFTPTLHIDMGILIDPISVMMLIVVTLIAFLVNVYSIGYMKGDTGFTKFFAFLSLFSFSMLGLVLATNLFQIYIFWELVGVSSFLLIGFYYTKPSAIIAAKKAFIVTRFADLFFLIGILLMGYYTGTFDFAELTSADSSQLAEWTSVTFMGMSIITFSLILIFIGGAGKSAMFPLHIWLPDAMEGPTPVSALIHAATMVVAGVYLVARLFNVYYVADDGLALEVVAYVGAFSSLFAAIIALTQNDIKRVLAFSTMSQIGYMMLALGVSGYEGHAGLGYMASMWHLFTHAMFKGLLFLAAGSIIHAVHSNMLKDMGSLRKKLPITHITFLIATLAIAGIPFFSGFFSKDEILLAAHHHNKFLYFVGLFVAGLTAFYMFRLYFGIFWGKEKTYSDKVHENPKSMTIPLMILAFMSIAAGYIPFSKYITADRQGFEGHIDWNMAAIAIATAVLGIALAYVFYKKETNYPEKVTKAFGIFYKWAYDKFYMDELYFCITRQIIFKRISAPFAWFDKKIIDGTMDLIGNTAVKTSEKIKGTQSGRVQDYAMYFIGGIVVITMVVKYIM
ncbi:MAG TPA: NADH-quinone oxidoreductase subunit L [Lutibacter sp.]|nr:NADH-quinone oxidoreductase subunit L [Lutibacter sp.]